MSRRFVPARQLAAGWAAMLVGLLNVAALVVDCPAATAEGSLAMAAEPAAATDCPAAVSDRPTAAELPNIVIIFTDDQGYQDVGCFGSPNIKTPHLDRMASEGMRFTDFYVAQAVCSASRAALLTGCYSNRVSILGALGPGSRVGIHDDEMTLAEVVKQKGYATAVYGKWHLGHHPQFLPPRHGFDEYYGLPYSNDMWPSHPASKFPPLPMIEGDRVVDAEVTAEEQAHLTTSYTERAVRFIERHKGRPFLVYLAHNMPHVPLFVSEMHRGRSARGLYGDVIEEIDWSVGQVLEALKRNGLDEKTLVIFTSDNGPWLSYGDHAGSALPLREGKGTMFDGGCREACIMRWPGRIPAGTVCRELCATIDILPTVARLVGAELPDHPIDGKDIWPLISGQPGAKSPHEAYYFYWGRELQAVRSGRWKLHFPHKFTTIVEPGSGGRPGKARQAEIGLSLFDLENDIGETTNVADQHPDVVERLTALAERAREELGDSATGRQGREVRAAGQLPPEDAAPRADAPKAAADGPRAATVHDRAHPIARRGEEARAAAAAGAKASQERRPNFVFFLVDDLGYMDVGCNNPQCFYETPNIDRLARSGMRMTAGYAASPVCSPTRYSIMTGRYPTRAGVTNFFSGRRAERFAPAPLVDRMAPEELTVAEALREGGYATCFAGKWHLGPSEEFWPERQGFDVNYGGWSAGAPIGPGKYFSPYGNPRLPDGPEGEHLPDRLATEVCRFIEAHRDGPFLVYLAFYSVHTPLLGRPDLVEKYQKKAERLGLLDRDPFADEEQVWPTQQPRRARVVQSHAVYAAMVEAMDQAVGKVLDRLDALGLAENTVVLFTSDNGGLSTAEGSPTSNLPLRAGKGWLYEGGIREPMLVRWPGVTRPGATCDVPVVTTDFYPTMLEMADLPPRPEQHQDGLSIVPLLKGGRQLEREAIYWHYPHYSNQGGFPGGAVRAGDWKLIERYEDGRVHLYNLAEDVGEQHDLAEQQPRRVADMRAKLHAWYKDVGAKFLEPKTPGGPMPWRP